MKLADQKHIKEQNSHIKQTKMHKACFVFFLLSFWFLLFFFFFLLEVFFTLPSCQNNNQRTLTLNCSCTKTTFDQIIIFRGILSCKTQYIADCYFWKGPDATFSGCALGVFKAMLIHIGGRMWLGQGWGEGTFPHSAAFLHVSEATVTL